MNRQETSNKGDFVLEGRVKGRHFKSLSRRETTSFFAGEFTFALKGTIDLLGEKKQFGQYVTPNNNESTEHTQ